MARKTRTNAALREAIDTINPTAPPTDVAERLKAIAEKRRLNADQAADLINGYFSNFKIDISAPPPMAILRSGYQIPATENMVEVVEHLKNALVGESVLRFNQSHSGDWNRLWKEISDEVEHIALHTHESSVRTIFGLFLYEAAQAQWSKLVNEELPFLEVGSLPSADIPAFLRLARKKLVLLLGKDTEEGLVRLRTIQEVVTAEGYQCQLVKDMPEHTEMGLIGKVLFAALSARFVVIENSAPSGHLYELPFVRMAECVIAILQQEGQGATWMTEDMIPKHALIRKFLYAEEMLANTVKETIVWAEERIAENIKTNRGAWPWANE